MGNTFNQFWGGSAALVLALALTACGTLRPAHLPSTSLPDVPPREEPLAPDASLAVAMHAMGLVGTPYRYGGNTPESGFDCSGLIGYVHWESARVRMPRTVAELSGWGQPVPLDAVRTGDVAVFTVRGRANHAGIYVGNGRFVHAPSSGGTVKLDRLDSGYWARQGLQFRRAMNETVSTGGR